MVRRPSHTLQHSAKAQSSYAGDRTATPLVTVSEDEYSFCRLVWCGLLLGLSREPQEDGHHPAYHAQPLMCCLGA